jgi:hypothetical protein
MAEWREFPDRRRDGMIHALSGGLWLHRHTLHDTPMAHLVSSDRQKLLEYGARHGLEPRWLQYKPLKDPRTGVRVEAWHWDLLGSKLPPQGGG